MTPPRCLLFRSASRSVACDAGRLNLIEVNLLPDGRKRAAKGGPRFSFSLPRFKGLPSDPWLLGAAGAGALALLAIGLLYFRVAGVEEELRMDVEVAVQDSARYADVIEGAARLRARSDSIAERVLVIQEIDGSRYVWPHLMDELGRALPEFTWLTAFTQVTPPPELLLRIQGRAGTYFALTTFMENLESSPFLRGVQLVSSDQVMVSGAGGAERPVYEFTLEAYHEKPPQEVLETVPLFGASVLPPGPALPPEETP